jgi:hypothetical protein
MLVRKDGLAGNERHTNIVIRRLLWYPQRWQRRQVSRLQQVVLQCPR